MALPLATSYAATKWAVLGFSASLREELRLAGHRPIRGNEDATVGARHRQHAGERAGIPRIVGKALRMKLRQPRQIGLAGRHQYRTWRYGAHGATGTATRGDVVSGARR